MSENTGTASKTRHQKYLQLRDKYAFFEFTDFSYALNENELKVTYHFNLSDTYHFYPSFNIPRKKFYNHFPDENDLKSDIYQQLLFHIGLIELISYWKIACPPLILIKPYKLNKLQVEWWKNLYFNGLGEFFYTNGIQAHMEDFVEIKAEGKTIKPFHIQLADDVIVPVGGGKDSVVTLELLKQTEKVKPFIINPRGATLACAAVAGFAEDEIITVNRRLDPLMLELNTQGFLNGHTPFSALLAFYGILISTVSGIKNIALSNESSANEPTVAGTQVNHQYSKSFAFEKDFRNYIHRYISEDYNYFSFLRPLSELKIAQLFAKQVKYYPVFKSCNVGSKTDTWCCNCPKCLFAFTILSPFIPTDELAHIFGKNLFEMPQMLPYFKELTGIADIKPFECVGTVDEVNAALQAYIHTQKFKKYPLLLEYYTNLEIHKDFSPQNAELILNMFDGNHFLSPRFLKILQKAIK